jgi:hypothetical protein
LIVSKGSIADRLRVLVPRFYEVETAYTKANDLFDDQTFAESTKPPATEEQIAALEAQLGKPLPPSYRAFLALWNGASFGFGGGADILGTADHARPHIQNTINDKRTLFTEFESRDPWGEGAIPFVVGDSRVVILFEAPVRADGEMDLVSYYLTGEEHRDRDVVEFFERQIAQHEAHLAKSKPKPKPKKKPKPRTKKKRT